MTEKDALKMVKDLTENSCDITYESNIQAKQQIISPNDFYEKYIQEFINQILKYESTN